MATHTTATPERSTGARAALGFGGVLAVVIGILILLWPERTASVATALIAVYAIGAGVVYAAVGLFAKDQKTRSRVGRISAAVVFLIVGILALLNLGQTTAWLAVFLGVAVGVTWIVEGILTLATLRESEHKALSITFAVVALVAGAVLVASPVWGIAVLWWLLGASLIVLGAMNALRALRTRRDR
ncbi:DUF308 domain-containing protein [Microbacterium aquimaris]|uniref:HdeD family acid-resistance protein n=1 Tax=Microbacterium aquimaris TaxID=459816 RepID=UPI002AD5826C|nr:DUF308 domain-containing protein [Microbacterium aquimaris]MDZ8276623.1 DUF308 domain-containing protein [Microbacterium aquimaris]